VVTDRFGPAAGRGSSPFDEVVGHRAGYASALTSVEEALWRQPVVDPVTLELCRLRIAQLLGCEAALRFRSPEALAAGLAEETVGALPGWPSDQRFDRRLRVCLGLAEQLVIDAQAVTDEMAAEVVAEIGEGAFLVLIYACGLFETTQRARLLIGASSW
jgi:alkylhydroperoxidase family enzyme